MKKYLLSILVFLTLFGCSGNKFMVAPATKDAGLEMFTRMYLPEGIETVEEAVRYVLMPTGYILALNCPACPSEAKTIAQDPISPLALKSELTTVRRAIALILGHDAGMVVDEKNKIMTFRFINEEEK